ncbi:DMT family transporter [Desulfurispira natronophila]|uniref:Drug/metabolite transporter (DMT)-like permease n=1 Tax=Desulfurispira natronophila TaxID=682562 RepID=A0A7W7Y3K3_9BACT|nr:DMT family transporter [Desulfurispira natronophila]MBB5021294.1 drug/metabolite transporter (DMT)-like permease [Desulfurispira natronophila]
MQKHPLSLTPKSRVTLLCITGVMILSTDALLIRLIEGTALQVTFWRALLMAVGFGILHIITTRSWRLQAIFYPDRATLLAGALFAACSLCFVAAIKHTLVANALFIVATVPLSAAAISWLALGEMVKRETWFAIAGALAGMTVIVAAGSGGGYLAGNLLAIGATVFLGAYLTVLRSGQVASALPALVIAALLTAGVAGSLAGDLTIPLSSIPWVVLLGLIVLPASFSLISLGPRHLPAPEVGLILLLEAIFGPVWVWLLLGERPAVATFVGGSLVLLSLLLRVWTARREHRKMGLH